MLNLRNSPFLWLAILLLISVWLGEIWLEELSLPTRISIGMIFTLCSVLSVIKYHPSRQFYSTFTIGALVISAGLLRVQDFKRELYPGNNLSESTYMEGFVMVKQVLKNKPGAVTLRCKSISLSDIDSLSVFMDKFIVLNIRNHSERYFFPGDVIGVRGFLSPVRGPLNPHAFDARVYYHTIGIRSMMYCNGEDIETDHSPKISVMRMAAKCQSYLSGIVRKNTRPEVAQLTNALVWGDRSDMNEDVRDAFADSGAMHVLSVSGMHVAIIYSLLFLLLGPPGAGTFLHRLLRFIIYSVAILMYVLLAGACPAVVRAGLMILLFVFGKAMGWNTQIWNLLGFAAFMMIWLNPFIWRNIGFQLSFLAIAGILLFAKPFIRWISFKNILLHRLWEITALSVTAQIFILPILLSQFHQFPLTFILSSFVAIPAAYVVMGAAILNVILSAVGWDGLWLLVDYPGHWFILSMKWMAGLNPLMHFSLPATAAVALMLMSVFFSLSLSWRWKAARKIAWCMAGLCLVFLAAHRWKQWNQNEITIYHSTKGMLCDVIQNGRCISIADPEVKDQNMEFATRGHRCFKDVISVRKLLTTQTFRKHEIGFENNMLRTPSALILFWEAHHQVTLDEKNISHLVVSHAYDIDGLESLLMKHPEVTLILPAHLKRNQRKWITQRLQSHCRKIHDIDNNGYFSLPL